MTNPKLAQSTSTGRVYRDPISGVKVPSVTTIISAGYPKPALIGWSAKMAAQYAVREWEYLGGLSDPEKERKIKTAHIREVTRASDLGTHVHAVCDAWQSGRSFPEWSAAADPYMSEFVAFLIAEKPKFRFLEVTLWSATHGYAGTADWIAEIRGKIVYGDIKTGKSLWPEVGMQLAALGHADYIIRPDGTREEMPPPEEYAALHLRPRSWKLVYLDHIEECWGAFLACKKILEWTTSYAPHILKYE